MKLKILRTDHRPLRQTLLKNKLLRVSTDLAEIEQRMTVIILKIEAECKNEALPQNK